MTTTVTFVDESHLPVLAVTATNRPLFPALSSAHGKNSNYVCIGLNRSNLRVIAASMISMKRDLRTTPETEKERKSKREKDGWEYRSTRQAATNTSLWGPFTSAVGDKEYVKAQFLIRQDDTTQFRLGTHPQNHATSYRQSSSRQAIAERSTEDFFINMLIAGAIKGKIGGPGGCAY
ncbi:hypothetical protein E1301_Tti012657 [Triplophysa tibetana]|uniref:Uncharacterized protein n=1 Tax=Triplophysa tibetana TaxID=1572043 RepID=A0A5A9PNJ0_9TELE|nr:hypothetical protein E1301_Tti012657 [Triplophysa tibetana]